MIKHRYTKNLKHTLFPTQDHSWFSNNSPNDIYVSIKVHQKDGFKEYKLQNYFANKLSSSPSVYAILGNAGEGKTFSLYKIALDILEGVYGISNTSISTNKKFTKSKLKLSQNKSPNNKLVPIIINFSDIYGSKTEEDIIECIYQKICKVADIKRFWFGNKKSEKTTKVLKRFLCTGKFVIMFDGYDEIINTNDRLAFSKVLIDFIRTYNSCYYIITSRTQVYESERFENIATENTVYLSPLSKEQIREFLSKWSFPKDKSDTQLFHRIINTVQLENVVTNPLLLTMVTHTYCKSDFVFSQSKTNLYKQCCNCLLENWEKQKFRLKRFKRFTILPNVELKIELLSQLAYEIYLGNGHNISESKVLKLWSSNEAEKIYYHGKTQEVLDNIITQSGLLEKTDTNLLRFRHRSFYEYFVALYLVKNVCSPTTSFEYVKSNENINFFYLSLLKDEKIVLGFLSSHLCDTKTVLDVLVERKISDREKLVNIIEGVLSKIDYEETSNLQAIGYIAQQYVEVRDLVLHDLVGKLEYCNSKETKVNIIVSLMTFSSKKQIKRVLKSHVNNINIKDLILYSGENIKDYSSFIIDIIDSNEEKRIFVENLAKEYQFDAIYNIYIQENSKLNKDIAIIGLLYMASDTELISFLKAKNFNNTVSYEMKKEITILQNKYTWIEKLKFSETDNLYTLIYLSKELIKNGFKVNISMIDNRLKFLISYILSDESGKIHCKLIDIPNFEIISQIEFSYHWNRRKQNKSNDTYIYNGVINAPLLNRVITSIIFLLVILQMILYLFHKIRIYDLVYTGWEVKFSSSNDFAMFPFNSMYLLFLGSIFVSCYIIHKFLRKIDYSNFSITLSICVSLILFTTYTFIVQNIFFRLSMLIVISCICICENIKHRYNYPSFKDPQYSLIVDYLK